MTTATALDRELDEMADRELRGESEPTPEALDPLVPAAPQEDRNLAVITHVGTIGAAVCTAGLLDVAVPAVAYVLFKDRSAFLKEHVKHQLNFQLTALLVAILGVVVSFATFGLGALVAVPAVAFYFVVDVVCSVKAALAASRGEHYRFPFAFDFIK